MLSVTKYIMSRGGGLSNHLSRLRHFRGHGVHSPFVYSIVRNVMMTHRLNYNATELFETLRTLGVDKRFAVEISNLLTYLSYSYIEIDNLHKSCNAIICSSQMSDAMLLHTAQEASKDGITLIILSPNKRAQLCRSIVKDHCSTSIDRLGYLILLNNHLPKQHFKL